MSASAENVHHLTNKYYAETTYIVVLDNKVNTSIRMTKVNAINSRRESSQGCRQKRESKDAITRD